MAKGPQKITAYEKALDLLGIRMHSSFELARKLKTKGYAPDEVSETIQRLIEERYLKDEDTALVYLENLMRYKTWGFYGIKSKLLQKGFASGIIENLLNEHFSVEAETKIAQRAIGKSNKSDSMKLAMMLKRKGFRNDVIHSATQNILE